jgi:cytidylate kinase
MEDAFDRRIAIVVQRAAIAAQVETPTPTTGDSFNEPEGTLRGRMSIDDDALDFVWTVVARAVEPRVGAYLRMVWGNDARIGVSLAQHMALAPLPPDRHARLLDILDPNHPLRLAGILVIAPEDGGVLDVGTRWLVAQRVWRFLRGDDALDPIVSRFGGLVTAPHASALSDAQRTTIDRLAEWLASRRPLTILVDGPMASGKRTAVALASERAIVMIDARLITIGEMPEALLALHREVVLRDAVPVIANLDVPVDSQNRDLALVVAQQLERFPGPVVITTSGRIEIPTRVRSTLRQTWPVPDIATRRVLWARALEDAVTDTQLDTLAMRYALGAGDIGASVQAARFRSNGERTTFATISAGVQDTIAERLGELAHRVVVRQSWDDLVLTPETLDDVRMLVARVRHGHHVLETWNFKSKIARGMGVAALFSGPPGTGKTMVAGLIAKELDLELYQVDLSRIVSKWVGETEKQLAKLFEAAEAGHALLLFDEADALFAKRSAEVKSAVDRYANLEVNYLLQRVESFEGVVILTTNLDASIDPALRRRLASHIVFGKPEPAEQLVLWKSMLATGAPLASDLKLDNLTEEFEDMTGANIRNAVLGAAFLASEEGSEIRADHLRRAARSEYRAMGHLLQKNEKG